MLNPTTTGNALWYDDEMDYRNPLNLLSQSLLVVILPMLFICTICDREISHGVIENLSHDIGGTASFWLWWSLLLLSNLTALKHNRIN